MRYGKIRLAGSTMLTAGLLGLTVPAAAQDALPGAPAAADSPEGEEVIVTGSRLARTDATAAAPLTVFSEEEIAESGTVFLSEVLRDDPALGSQTRGPSNILNGGGATSVNLRNLGNRRTLVVINGRRFPIFSDALGNAGQDIGAIPASLVERVEVLRDGASTAYGADAVSGVVNFILRRRFDGLQLDAYTGISDEGDGFAYRLAGTYGIGSDRGSLILSAQYLRQEPIIQSQRDWSSNLITSLNGAGSFNSPITPGGTVVNGANQLLACYPNSGGANVAPNCPLYDPSAATSLIAGVRTIAFGAVATYELTDWATLNAQVFYSDRESEQRISAFQINTGSVLGPFQNGFLIPATNSNNPYGQAIRLRWRPEQYGSRDNVTDAQMLWASIGLEGRLFGDFRWEVSHTYGETESLLTVRNQVDAVALNRLLNPAACAADPACASVGAIANIADLLSGTTPLTAGQQGYLFFDSTSDNKFTSQQTLASISGPLFNLPGGGVQLALGGELRKETGRVIPDEITQSGNGAGTFIFPTDGEYSTREVFAELEVPLLSDRPFLEELSLNLQARYSDFSNFGGADTYKVSLNYAPSRDLRFRGTWGTSFRAPDIIELYGGGTGATRRVQDPCNAGGLRATNAAVAANCDALGVPANFQQLSANLPTRGGGNPGLEPEKGEAFTIGAVVTPTFLPGLTATVDYFNFEIENAISGGLLQENLNACYGDPNFLTRAQNITDICYSFNVRSPTGELGRIEARSTNLASLSTSGIDFAVNYQFESVAGGTLRLGLRGSWLDEFNQGGVNYAGSYISALDGRDAYPEWRGQLEAEYRRDRWSAQWTVNYVSSMTDANVGTTIPVDNFLDYEGTPDYWSHDLLVRFEPTETLSLAVGVNNVFDKDPPYAFVTTRNALATLYDQLGRYFFTTARIRF